MVIWTKHHDTNKWLIRNISPEFLTSTRGWEEVNKKIVDSLIAGPVSTLYYLDYKFPNGHLISNNTLLKLFTIMNVVELYERTINSQIWDQ